jgi:hypothetical protein
LIAAGTCAASEALAVVVLLDVELDVVLEDEELLLPHPVSTTRTTTTAAAAATSFLIRTLLGIWGLNLEGPKSPAV